ncbi:MAG: oxygen-independent coproporphyrinogen III oxidase [Bacteriovoracaceae bacterium]
MEKLTRLIEKYNTSGPRYTSYPPVPFWQSTPTEEVWIKQIRNQYQKEKCLDLYVHIPYCESLCYYCGCSRVINKSHDQEDDFVNVLLKEWSLYKEKLGFTPKINSLHFGGGTPTYLSAKNLERIINELSQERNTDFIGSIEIDPRTCNEEHLKVLSDTKITRVSFGIQDFDPKVQQAINRNQSVKLVTELVNKIRAYQFNSLNFDLIYGLPKQTEQSIQNTIETVAELSPDLIAFYSYAHLPDKIKNQRLIKNEDLPTPQQKLHFYQIGKSLLKRHHFYDIGLDHFAKEDNFLYQAKKEERLHRNFMGYVDKKSPILIGLGPTSISDSSMSFIQNQKEIKDYKAAISQNKLPIEKGHVHSEKDLSIQKIILEIMCKKEATFKTQDLPYWEEILKELKSFEEDEILALRTDGLKVTEQGHTFIRNIAMVFDFYLREQKGRTKFSQTV